MTMTENWNQDTPLHLADDFAEEIAHIPADVLLAEVAEEFGDRRALVRKFDNAVARALRQRRRRRIAAALKGFAAQASEWLFWKPVLIPVGALAVALLAVIVYHDRNTPPYVTPDVPVVAANLETATERALEERKRDLEERSAALRKELEATDRALRTGNAADIRLALHDEPAAAEPLHDVAISLNNLADFYRAQGRYADAEPLYKRALAIREKALGPDHPDIATSLNTLAELYRAQGRYADAEPLYKRSLAIREKALGPDHRE
jgi:tetratricopeptide (TPR) repeat protein